MQLIVFTKKEKYYGIRTENVGEIIKNTKIFPVPQSPEWVEGLINLRGTIVTLVNFSKYLNVSDSKKHENIIIVKNNEDELGVLVESILGVYDVEQDIQQIEKDNLNIQGIISVDNQLVNVVNIMPLFYENGGLV